MTEIPLKINIRYMITKNINVSDGLANGVSGILKHITFKKKRWSTSPKTLWFDFQSKRIGNNMKSNFLERMKKEKIELNLVPIEATRIDEFGRNEAYKISRKQFPIAPAEAITVHKSQGCTYKKICVDLTQSSFINTSMVYVAYSRVSSLEGLYIIDRVTIPSFNKSGALDELEKLRNSRQLKLSYDRYIIGDEFKIIYQNVNSLYAKLQYIVCDNWYKQGDMLVFTEIYTKPKHTQLEIPGYTILYRHDSNENQSGIIVYIKDSLYNKYKDLKFTSNIESGGKRGAKYHLILLHFCFNEINIITGYESPLTPMKIFENHLIKWFTSRKKIISSSSAKAALLGDFNENTIDDDSSLAKFLSQFGLFKVLKDEVTTNNDTYSNRLQFFKR